MIARERCAQTPWKRSQEDSADANVTFEPVCARWTCCLLHLSSCKRGELHVCRRSRDLTRSEQTTTLCISSPSCSSRLTCTERLGPGGSVSRSFKSFQEIVAELMELKERHSFDSALIPSNVFISTIQRTSTAPDANGPWIHPKTPEVYYVEPGLIPCCTTPIEALDRAAFRYSILTDHLTDAGFRG